MRPCNALHPMIRVAPETLSAEEKSMGEWLKCPRCDKVALIPAGSGKVESGDGRGRHLA